MWLVWVGFDLVIWLMSLGDWLVLFVGFRMGIWPFITRVWLVVVCLLGFVCYWVDVGCLLCWCCLFGFVFSLG